MGFRILQNSFLGGVVSPALLGRVDLANYQQGAYELTNFIVQPQGSITTRGGFRYVAPCKNHNSRVRLIPFRFASDQTLVLVFGAGYMRIVTQGLVQMNGGSPYEISTPYSEEDIFNLEYTQNADIITLTNPNHPPKELRRYGATDWRLVDCVFAAEIEPPKGLKGNAIYPSGTSGKDKGTVTAIYVVTSVDENGKESVASATCNVSCNYYLTGGSVELSWEPVSGAQYYRIYRDVAGIFGFLGQTEGTLITDVGDNPDTTYTPPRYDAVFAYENGIKSIEVLDGGSEYSNQTDGDSAVVYLSYLPVGEIRVKFNNSGMSLRYKISFISPSGATYIAYAPTGMTWKNKGDIGESSVYDFWAADYTSDGIPVTFDGAKPDIKDDWRIKVEMEDQYWHGWREYIHFINTYADGSAPSNASAAGKQHFAASDSETMNKYKAMWESSNGIQADMLLPSSSTLVEKLDLEISGGTGAKAQATAIDGVIRFVTVLAPGQGYSESSRVTVVSAKGSGARFKVHVFGKDDCDYPSANTQYDQRRVFAGTYNSPVKVLMTNAGMQDLMMYHLPTMADDRISLEAVTADADRIIHAVALDSLLLFTRSAELRVFTQNSDSLSPDSVAVRVQSYVGSNQVQPVMCNSNVLYAASRGGHLRSLNYTYTAQGYSSTDLSLIASHLFDSKEIVDLAISKAPSQIAWCVSSDGNLNALTYYPEQNVTAWAVVETDGAFESCCVVSEGKEDHLYVVVRRVINGQTRRYIERLEYINVPDNKEQYRQLDCFIDNQEALQTLADGATEVTGLDHLEGKEVTAYVDGVAYSGYKVTGGRINIAQNGSNIAVGIPYQSRLVTMPIASNEAQGQMQSLYKTPSGVFFRVRYEGDIWAGAKDSGEIWRVPREELTFKTTDTRTQLTSVNLTSAWRPNAQVVVEHRDAYPLEVSAIVGEYSFEGYKK